PEQLVEAVVALPLLAPEPDALFHADPHAGNLLYDDNTGQIVILDWALTERISREQRRHLALLFLFTALRDPAGLRAEVQALSRGARDHGREGIIRDTVDRFIDRLPLTRIAGAVDTMDVLAEA